MLEKLDIQPGLFTESSDRQALNRWKDGSNVRFFKGNPEKIGGWEKQIATAFVGVCRAMLAWTTLSFSRLCALGTSSKLYLSDMESFFDITPLRESGTLGADPFATTLGSAIVTVSDAAHGLAAGDYVHYTGATAVATLDLNAEFAVQAIVDSDHYTITASASASATTTGGGAAVAYEYEIPVGNVDTILGGGWGVGGWGLGTWGTARTSTLLQIARIWSFAKWGEDLLASPVDCPMYVWLASGGTSVRAALITQAPAQNRRILVSTQLRIAISFGSHDGSDPDPMLIRWSDSEDYTNWTPDITNLAGDKRLDQGNEIITALPTRNEIAVITDETIYSMAMSGDDIVFNFDHKGAISGLVGPNAAVDANGTVYGMGDGSYWTYDGTIKELNCDVLSRVFGEADDPAINSNQAAKTFADWNKKKSEVIWFYPSAGSEEIDSCVGVSTTDGTWWLGTAACTAHLSKHPFKDRFTVPLGCAINPADGLEYLYLRETGTDADGAALPYFLETGDSEIAASSNGFTGASTGQGEKVWRIKKLVPDFIRLVGNHTATLKGRKKPNGKLITKGPISFGENVLTIDGHIRSRQIAVRIGSDELGSDISIGSWRADASIEGRR